MTAPLSPDSFHRSIHNIMCHNSATSGPAQVPGNTSVPAHDTSTSSAGDASSGYESGMSSFENACNKSRSLKCTKACCKGKGKAKDRRVKIVTSSDIDSSEKAEATESASDQTTTSAQSSPNFKKNNKNKGKGKAVQNRSEIEDGSSAQTGGAPTDLETAVKYTTPSVDDPSWSISEDYRLRGMKEAGETWKFITDSLCKSKSDVRARWKILQSQTIASEATTKPETGEATTEPETGDATTEGESDRAAVEVASGHETTSDNETSDQDEESEESCEDADEDDADDDADEQTEEENDFVPSKKDKTHANMFVNNKWHRGTRNQKVAIENKWAKARAKAKAQDHDDSPMESGQGASDNSSESSSRFDYVDPEKREQMKYLHKQIYEEMYPADIHPQPDAYLNERDCALLSTIDSKYKQSRWLEMQANFYNVTGRMVPLEAIRDRCERAEAEKEARSEARKLDRRIKRVEKWMEDQGDED
ncbi:hypothetical protein FLAG1_02372 [Fusarium langsethiae]|uniref:Myb-like domain-containing protein n=1 Tax=Fusarium langsethiae TaxID=179993 RepID=A0A0N0V803_FUSLA|nr:hypothetical protein FLAG1_02372 [Fusarium langsethiae]GKU00323.1 unnamed protein product [Fusarium langsethiae]GKU13928.1 unnamed protein product [Fusarium langsethiae]